MTAPSLGERPPAAARRLGSSLRTRDPGETFALAAPLMAALGISRVTDITRMDRLGLPVFASIRPRSLTLHVHAGKGVHAAEARVGALMEAIEYAVAEPARTPWERRAFALGELLAALPGNLRALDFAPRMDATLSASRRVDAVRCELLGERAGAWLPAELVFVPFEPDDGEALFGWSTNGLASGNTLEEATLHALLEVLERDAIALNSPRDHSRRVDTATLPAPFDALADDWRRLGVTLAVRQVPNAFDLPCFVARLHERESTSIDLAEGCGLHLDRHIALARAVCEAAQSRLSHIHGGRDDITQFHEKLVAPDRRPRDGATLAATFDRTRRVAFDDIAQRPTDAPVAALLQRLLADLRQRGFGQVFRHRFDIDLGGLHVVKVIVARCEEMDAPPRRMGARLFRQVVDGA